MRLMPPADLPEDAVGKIMFRRASTYRLSKRQLLQSHLSSILWYGLAPVRVEHPDPSKFFDLNYFVSPGRVFEIFFAAFNVQELLAGLYFYDIGNNTVELIRQGDFRKEVQHCLIGQHTALNASCTLFVVVDVKRVQRTYRHERVLRTVYIHSGKIMYYLVMIATAFRLRTSITPAIRDSKALQLLKLDPAQYLVLYTLSLT